MSFYVGRGEILGFAGAEGNGQRDAIRALGGLERCDRRRRLRRRADPHAARRARRSPRGILSLSADRAQELVFPALGVRENMTLQVLDDFAGAGLVSARTERGRGAARWSREYGIVTPSLEQPISGLSGGNQQKSVLARGFLYGADVVLIDEPTQGVDARRPLRHLPRHPRQGGRGRRLHRQLLRRAGARRHLRPRPGLLARPRHPRADRRRRSPRRTSSRPS